MSTIPSTKTVPAVRPLSKRRAMQFGLILTRLAALPMKRLREVRSYVETVATK